MRRGDRVEAAKRYALAVDADPLSSRIRVDYGLSLESSADLDGALEQFQIVLEQEPDEEIYPEMVMMAGLHIAQLGLDRGGAGSSIAALDRALGLRTDELDRPDLDARAHALMAEALASTGDLEGSRLHWDRAVTDAWRAATLSGRGGARGRAALRVVKRACEQSEFERIGYLEVLAAAHLNMGQAEELLVHGRRAVDLARERGAVERAGRIEARIRLYVERYGSGDRPPFDASVGHPLAP
jgi:tetratricopeptide (TPR) repeat protein